MVQRSLRSISWPSIILSFCALFSGVVVLVVQSTDHEFMRVLRQCKVPRAEVIFFTVQRGNIRPSKKEMNKAVTMLNLPDVCS
jgi:hypothetical protein